MQIKMNHFRLSAVVLATVFFVMPLCGQVTIGEAVEPQPFSLLEISTAIKDGGLRMPQLTTQQREDLDLGALLGQEAIEAKGLIIYNIETKCLEFWNGEKWVSLCTDLKFDPSTLSSGEGLLSGKICFDIAENFCESISTSARPKTDFNGLPPQTYTFTVTSATATNLRYYIIDLEGVVEQSVTPLSGTLEAGSLVKGQTVTLNIKYKDGLNSASSNPLIHSRGRSNAVQPAQATLYIVYNDGTEDIAAPPMTVSIQDCACGCSVKSNLPGSSGWLTFMCYNLGVPEETKSWTVAQMVAYTPSPDVHLSTDETVYGRTVQWGRKDIQARNATMVQGPLSGADLDNNGQPVSTYANNHILDTCPLCGYDWRTPSDSTLWNSGTESAPVKTVNDPCPAGWRVPTQTEWVSIFGPTVGAFGTATVNTWAWSYRRGCIVTPSGSTTPTLFLPTAGFRNHDDYPTTVSATTHGLYWTSTYYDSTSPYVAHAYSMFFNDEIMYLNSQAGRTLGHSVRCIAE